ncbi:V-set and transmembrane domain-containing protein 2A-like [Nelusetta ayraudi]|uniref:V-set and transmembrane domain-containing protein 2A-like n=1 Tax=Nelusetta ayraudi TaxID=303726 RepID=UPI003F71AAE5
MMWTSHDTVGFVFLAGFCVHFGFCFEGRFTDLPSNMTVKEGQNLEMACAFQSGTSSVYLEIQWWFLKAPEPSESPEDVDADQEPALSDLTPWLYRGGLRSLQGVGPNIQQIMEPCYLQPPEMQELQDEVCIG